MTWFQLGVIAILAFSFGAMAHAMLRGAGYHVPFFYAAASIAALIVLIAISETV